MTTETPRSELNDLRQTLQQTLEQGLPPEARTTIQRALQQLRTLPLELTSGEEQTHLAALFRVSRVLSTSLDLGKGSTFWFTLPTKPKIEK
ncbi:MAG: hypothetical protein AB1345_09315 [Chloroflexota bacterium]